jgi:hypothetical protein
MVEKLVFTAKCYDIIIELLLNLLALRSGWFIRGERGFDETK